MDTDKEHTLESLGKSELTRVREIMLRAPNTVYAEASVQDAVDELSSQGVGSSPVTSKDCSLIGTVSLDDLNRNVGGKGHDPKAEPVIEQADPESVFCFEDHTVGEAREIMMKNKLRELPVLTHEKKMIGIVTLENITKASAK